MRKVIPILVLSSVISSGFYAESTIAASDNANSAVWTNPNSKAWGGTPAGVRTALSRVKVLGGSDVNIFNVQWLKEMSRSPSMYHLTDTDVKWANQVIKNADARKRNVWSPNGKVVIEDTPPVEVKQQEVKRVKAESKTLPKPMLTAENKHPDLTPVKESRRERHREVKKVVEVHAPVKPTISTSVVPNSIQLSADIMKAQQEADQKKYAEQQFEQQQKLSLLQQQYEENQQKIAEQQKQYDENQKKIEAQQQEEQDQQSKIQKAHDDEQKRIEDQQKQQQQLAEEQAKLKAENEAISKKVIQASTLSVAKPAKIDTGKSNNWFINAISTLSVISGIMFLILFLVFRNATKETKRKYF